MNILNSNDYSIEKRYKYPNRYSSPQFPHYQPLFDRDNTNDSLSNTTNSEKTLSKIIYQPKPKHPYYTQSTLSNQAYAYLDQEIIKKIPDVYQKKQTPLDGDDSDEDEFNQDVELCSNESSEQNSERNDRNVFKKIFARNNYERMRDEDKHCIPQVRPVSLVKIKRADNACFNIGSSKKVKPRSSSSSTTSGSPTSLKIYNSVFQQPKKPEKIANHFEQKQQPLARLPVLDFGSPIASNVEIVPLNKELPNTCDSVQMNKISPYDNHYQYGTTINRKRGKLIIFLI